MKTNEEVWSIVNALKALYPDSLCSLEYEKDYELLFSVRLAAQCTDERVNKVIISHQEKKFDRILDVFRKRIHFVPTLRQNDLFPPALLSKNCGNNSL